MVDADDNSNDTTPQTTENTENTETPGATENTGAPENAGAADKPAAKKTTARKTTARKTTTRKSAKSAAAPDAAAADAAAADESVQEAAAPETAASAEDAGKSGQRATRKTAAKTAAKTTRKSTAKKTTAKRTSAAKSAAADSATGETAAGETAGEETAAAEGGAAPRARKTSSRTRKAAAQPAEEATADEAAAERSGGAPTVLFQAPETKSPARKRATSRSAKAKPADGGDTGAATEATAPEPTEPTEPSAAEAAGEAGAAEPAAEEARESGTGETGEGGARRRRRRGGRRRRKGGDGDQADSADEQADEETGAEGADEQEGGGSRRRRKRRRAGEEGDSSGDDPQKTVTKVRKARNPEDEITSVSGSTRLEAKKQRRREGREAGRRRAPIVSEAEFLARRESVERVMVIRQHDDLTQIAVLEDKVLVEHYVAREAQTSLIGNVYLGRVQNVLPSMEAAFVDIGKGRNAVLYAGEVNWTALGHPEGQPRKIESVLSPGQTVLVQVTKDPIGHKGARLTGQVSLPGRFLVYVPDGTTSGISRKLPDTERNRLKTLLKAIVPDTAGVIVRTAAEGASEEELTRDVERLTARWDDIDKKVAAGKAPELLYGEPDLTLKVVRDLFTEDFARLVVQGDDAWDLVEGYVSHVAPDLRERLERFQPGAEDAEDGARGKDQQGDVFAAYRVDEQIAKGLDRKVWLPSGGSLIIDRTEAMTVVDVNTGKFTGSGGNLEETVTKNNLEAAEEIVRQLRLRDIGGIIVVDFIDMVLESNRDLVLRRLVECLGRDRTRHQVAEVTSLGLVQMTRKRIGTGLLEAFSEDCPHCKGRGVLVHEHPVEPGKGDDDQRGRRSRGGRGRGSRSGSGNGSSNGGGSNGGGHGDNGRRTAEPAAKPSPMDLVGTKPPADAPAAEDAEDAEDAEASAAAQSAGLPEPVAAPAPEPAADAEPAAGEPSIPAQPEAPRVVTTTRRRTARRPAGAPTPREEASYDPTPASEASDEEETGHEEAGHEGPAVAHVPIKRKGARKR